MAGFKQRSLTLHQLQSMPNAVDLNTIDIFYLNDGSIRAQAGDGTSYRLDNVDSTLIDVSGQLYSLIQTVSGDLVVYVNSVSGSLYDQFIAADAILADQITAVDSSAVHKTGNEVINGIKTFGDVAYFMNGMVINGEIIEVGTLEISASTISLNVGTTGIPTLNAGINVVRGIYPESQILWNESLGYWTAGISGGLEKIILQSDLNAALLSISGGTIANMQAEIIALSGNVTTISGDINTIYGELGVINSSITNISGNVTNLNSEVASISANYTPLVTTANISGNLQSQINDISAVTLTNYYTKAQTNAITANLYADYTNSDNNILSYVTTISSQQKAYIDGNFVNLSTNQTISGNKSFVNTNNQIVLSTQNTTLNDSAGIASQNWNSRFLYDNLGINSLDWKNRELYDALLNVTVDWEFKHLYTNWSADSFNVLSLPVSGASNFVTWDASKKLVDSGINLNTLNTQTANISSNLQTQITQISGYVGANTNGLRTLFSTYANSTTVAAISAGLVPYIGATSNVDLGSKTLTAAQLNVNSNASSSKGIVVKGAVGQTANLLETQNSFGTILDAVYADGGVQIGGTFGISPGAGILRVSANSSNTIQTLPAGTLSFVTGADGVDARYLIGTYGTGNKSCLSGRHARGTCAIPTASQLDDVFIQYGAWGYGTTGFSSVSRGHIQIYAAENWTDTAQGTRISFFTTTPGGTTTSERMRIWGDGGISVGSYLGSAGAGSLGLNGLLNLQDSVGLTWANGDGNWRTSRNRNDFAISMVTYGYVSNTTYNAVNNGTVFGGNGGVSALEIETYSPSPRVYCRGVMGIGIIPTYATAQLSIQTNASTVKGITIQGASSQSANLLETQNSSGTTLFKVDSVGSVTSVAISGTADNIVTHDANGKLRDSGVNISAVSTVYSGRTACDGINNTFNITHTTIDPNVRFPIVTMDLLGPTNDIYITGVYSRAASSFNVVLSSVAPSGCGIMWHLT